MDAARFYWIGPGTLWGRIGDLKIVIPPKSSPLRIVVDEGRLQALIREGLATLDDAKVLPPRHDGEHDDCWAYFDAYGATLSMNDMTKPSAEVDKIFAEMGAGKRIRSPYS